MSIVIMLYISAYKWVKEWHASALYWRGQQFKYSYNSITAKHIVYFFSTYDSVLMIANVCEILVLCRRESDRSKDLRSNLWLIYYSLGPDYSILSCMLWHWLSTLTFRAPYAKTIWVLLHCTWHYLNGVPLKGPSRLDNKH